MHGREDTVVSVEQSHVLLNALDGAGVDAVYHELHDLGHVWTHDGPEAIESERVAMDLLAADPTPAQSVRETTHVGEGGTGEPLVDGVPPRWTGAHRPVPRPDYPVSGAPLSVSRDGPNVFVSGSKRSGRNLVTHGDQGHPSEPLFDAVRECVDADVERGHVEQRICRSGTVRPHPAGGRSGAPRAM